METKVTHRENGEGLYDISATATFPPDTEIESPSEFVCELRIPEANYTVRKEYVYYEGKTHPLHVTLFHTTLEHIDR